MALLFLGVEVIDKKTVTTVLEALTNLSKVGFYNLNPTFIDGKEAKAVINISESLKLYVNRISKKNSNLLVELRNPQTGYGSPFTVNGSDLDSEDTYDRIERSLKSLSLLGRKCKCIKYH